MMSKSNFHFIFCITYFLLRCLCCYFGCFLSIVGTFKNYSKFGVIEAKGLSKLLNYILATAGIEAEILKHSDSINEL